MTDDARPPSSARVLGVGVAALDVINRVEVYPEEDDEVRALEQDVRRGGNATNTLVTLAQLGHRCAWAGTLGDDAASEQILADLGRHGVDASLCVRHAGGHTPTSYVTLSRASGSRTIVHHRDLPELSAQAFSLLELDRFDWVHFEGRDPDQTALMLRDLAARHAELPVSLEVEKPRSGVERLFDGPRVLIFSRVYAASRGYADPVRFLADQWSDVSAELLFLAWGEGGAYGQARGGPVQHARSYAPSRVVDTLGAGDVFNSALIDGLLAGTALDALLERANRLAGHKCGRRGLHRLVVSARSEGWG